MENSLEMALAWPGFMPPPPKRPEQAGISYEVFILRDHLSRGDDLQSCVINEDLYGKLRARFTGVPNGVDDFLNGNGNIPDVDSSDTLWLDEETKSYERYLLTLDPKHWREQDHYKVLGLSTLRFAATEEQIRLAYRKKVLKHHPDKRRHRGLEVKAGEDDYFTCISRAYEILSHPQKRRAFDSVDPTFDDFVPSCTKTAEEFFETFSPVFERNERWSRIQPVPKLGDANTPYDDVDGFYWFWYNKFESWREFSYLDEEDKEKGENREERRWIEKQNKAAREKRRKDELRRLRSLIENAEKSDPRIQRYREEEKKRKEEDKRAREEARRSKLEEEQRQREEAEAEERRRKEEVEESQKQQLLAEKREKEAKKKVLQKERKSLQDFLKEHGYFSEDDSERVSIMTEMDRLGKLLPLERLRSLNEELRCATNGTKPREVFDTYVEELNRQVQIEEAERVKTKPNAQEDEKSAATWTHEEAQLLVKGMTVFPVGTKSRWEVVATFINEHRKATDEASNAKPKTAKDVVKKVKDLEKLGETTKEMAAKGQALKPAKSAAQVDAPPSTRMEAPGSNTSQSSPWTTEEQKIFEQALRTYPSSLGSERWEKVAQCLPSRTKKECIKRFKELSELVRAKKTALQKTEAK